MDEQPDVTETEMEMACSAMRREIKDIGDNVKYLMNHEQFKGEEAFKGQHGEMGANIMLTFRHLEDARMRLGKVMQQIQGGVSHF